MTKSPPTKKKFLKALDKAFKEGYLLSKEENDLIVILNERHRKNCPDCSAKGGYLKVSPWNPPPQLFGL